jgi:hypothetical protein
VVRHIFQAFPVWIYTQSNITSNSMHGKYNYSTVLIHVPLYCGQFPMSRHNTFSFKGHFFLYVAFLRREVFLKT